MCANAVPPMCVKYYVRSAAHLNKVRVDLTTCNVDLGLVVFCGSILTNIFLLDQFLFYTGFDM